MVENNVVVHKCQCQNTAVVDIVMLAYNHGEFIEKALESILMQRTQYTYRIIIGEDCSKDSTQQIIMDYYKRYPDKMELYLWGKNVGMTKNGLTLLKQCHAKYIAFLEGDDYWVDPLKLEKQITFLEKHPEYIGTVHNIRDVDKNGIPLHNNVMYPIQEEHIYGVEQASRWEMAAQTASMLYRNIHVKWSDEDWEAYAACKVNDDFKINITLGLSGDIFYFRDIMAHHRRVFIGDSWTAKTSGKNLLWINYMFRLELQKYIEETLQKHLDTKAQLDLFFGESCMKVLCEPNRENIGVWWKLFIEKSRRKKIGT